MINKNLKKHWFFFALGLAFLLRLPSLFEPFTYGDEGVYLTLGQAIRRGLILYRDIHDNKPPLLYLVAALAGNFSSFRLILFLWSFATIYFFKKLAESLFRQKEEIKIATFAFVILSSIRTLEGNVANAENFLIGTSILGFYFLLSRKKTIWAFFLAGFFFSLSFLFKIPGVFDFLAALIITFFLRRTDFKSIIFSLVSARFWAIILGFLILPISSFVYFSFNKAIKEYFLAAFAQNIPYLSSWLPNKPQMAGFPLSLILRAILVFIFIIFLFVHKKRISEVFLTSAVWYSFSLFAALLSSRPYPHYLLQTIPSLSLILGLIRSKTKEKLLPLFSLAIFLFIFIFFKFWFYSNAIYYLNFYQYLLHLKNKEEYFVSFDAQANYLYQTAFFIKIRTKKNEPIFIWSNKPSLYALTERPVVGRYTTAYHIIDFEGYQETIIQLQEQQPKYIIIDQEEKHPFDIFFNWLEKNYTLEKTIGNFQIYRHLL